MCYALPYHAARLSSTNNQNLLLNWKQSKNIKSGTKILITTIHQMSSYIQKITSKVKIKNLWIHKPGLIELLSTFIVFPSCCILQKTLQPVYGQANAFYCSVCTTSLQHWVWFYSAHARLFSFSSVRCCSLTVPGGTMASQHSLWEALVCTLEVWWREEALKTDGGCLELT